jgi:N-methylhydantoinase B
VLRDLGDGYVSLDGAREDYGVVIADAAVDLSATEELRESKRGARKFATVKATDAEDHDELQRRRIPVSAEFAAELGVGEMDLVELVREAGPHLRGWVKIDPELEGATLPLGPRARGMCGAEEGGRVQIRQPWTYAMRRQQDDLAIELPTGSLFATR